MNFINGLRHKKDTRLCITESNKIFTRGAVFNNYHFDAVKTLSHKNA